MNPDTPGDSVTSRRVLYDLPGTDAVSLRTDFEVQSSDAGTLVLDSYLPPKSARPGRPPLVVMVAGYPDAGMQRVLGCRFKETAFTVSWARLMAASGMAVITYSTNEPLQGLTGLLDHVRDHDADFGVDGTHIGLWASSGNVAAALSALIERPRVITCAALCYGYTLDLEGADAVAAAAAQFGFRSCPAAIERLPKQVPLFVARAGQDSMPRLNEALDRFVAAALAANLPLTLVNHAAGPHAFDLFDDSETTRETIRAILRFLKFHLLIMEAAGGPADKQ